MRRVFALLIAVLIASAAGPANTKQGARNPRADIPATCAMILSAAQDEGIEPMILARLLWDLTRFKPAFDPRRPRGRVALLKMPRLGPGVSGLSGPDAAAVGLDDPYDPAQAIPAAARSLSRYVRLYGNIGLAVAGYRLDNWRMRRFIAGDSKMPGPVADLVSRVTGTPAELWRDAPPVRLLGDDTARFARDCAALAEPPPPAPAPPPWGVILSTQPDLAGATELAARYTRRLEPVLGGRKASVHSILLPGRIEPTVSIQIGTETGAEATALCNRLRGTGLSCMVLKNKAAP